jgi:hypothetical protein
LEELFVLQVCKENYAYRLIFKALVSTLGQGVACPGGFDGVLNCIVGV